MDLSFVKQKLSAQQNKGAKKFEKIDYSKIFWKPKVGSYQIRIIPNKYDSKWPLREMSIHYGYSKAPIFSLTNWGEKDPIVEFVSKLRKSPDSEDWKLANKLQPKVRYFAPVLVRGEEHLGVRLWEVGKLVNDQLLKLANNDDYGDFTDINEGRDFTVDTVEEAAFGKKVIKATLLPKVKTSPISSDAEIVKKALEEQPDILSINRKYEFETLKELFEKWINGKNDSVEPEPDVEDNPSMEEIAPVITEVSKGKGKTKKTDKFQHLFDETPSNDEINDLPF